VGEDHLSELQLLNAIAPVLIERARLSLRGKGFDQSDETSELYGLLRRELVILQGKELNALHRSGEIGERTRRRIQRELDLDAERFTPH
jgi:hypothetical protein